MTTTFPTPQQRINGLITVVLLAGGGTVSRPAGWTPTSFLQGLLPKPQKEHFA